MKGLTKKQFSVLEFIKNYINENNISPSYREIQQYFGYSSLGTVYDHLKTLKQKGFIQFKEHSARSLSLNPQPNPSELHVHKVQVAGFIEAGFPIKMNGEDAYIEVLSSLLESVRAPYAFRIVGDGFYDELLGDGDLIIIDARDDVYDGEMALIITNEQEVVIRRLYHEGSYVRLTAITHYQTPIILRKGDYTVHGAVATVIREL